MCERWVGDGTDCHILTPSSSDYSSTSSSFCWAAQSGSWGPKPSVWSWFSLRVELNCNSNSNWLNSSVVPGYIIVWRLPASCGRPICTKFNPSTGQGDSLISSTGCTFFLIDGSVDGQYVTVLINKKKKKKKTCHLMDFAIPANHRMKMKETKGTDKNLDLASRWQSYQSSLVHFSISSVSFLLTCFTTEENFFSYFYCIILVLCNKLYIFKIYIIFFSREHYFNFLYFSFDNLYDEFFYFFFTFWLSKPTKINE